jgi:peptidoglycan hydrolase-like protein with peptidoglycan-binding domain
VGRTQYFGNGVDTSDTMGPHLHFEVSNARYPVVAGETSLDNPRGGGRIDPLEHLESLRGWGARKFYFPLVRGASDEVGHEVGDESAQRLFEATERDDAGGYFPLGANNIWHGGVHLRADPEALVRAPFDAKVVALRLDPDAVRAHGAFGSVNFVLLHHELPDHVARSLAGTRTPAREPWRGAVGRPLPRVRRRREVPNSPEHVREVKQLLHELGHYNPEDPALVDDGSVLDAPFLAAIIEFQGAHADGVIDIPGTSHARLPEAVEASRRRREDDARAARGEPPARPRMVYSLVMHLRAEPLEDALVERIPWLARMNLEPTADETAREAAERAERSARLAAEIAEDGPDRTFSLRGDVGPPRRRRSPANAPDDVRWVQRRLRRHHAFSGEPDGLWSASLDAAVRAFQTAHVPYYRGRPADASISPTGSTSHTLRMTPSELETQEHDPEAAGAGTLDRRFAARAAQVDATTGVAQVLTGLDVTIYAGEPIWTAGVGLAFAPSDVEGPGIATRAADEASTSTVVHWEIFTEEPLLDDWEQIDDDRDDDLAVDVPSLINRVQASVPPPEPFDEAYDDPTTAPPEDGASEPAEVRTLGEDDVLSLTEIRSFYAGESSRFLREVQCRFTSEWGVNPSSTVDALRALGWNTRLLAARLAPYLWWDAAGTAVPSSPLVWHYNPIAFMQRYARLFPQPPDPPPTPSPSEPSPDPDADLCSIDPAELICE